MDTSPARPLFRGHGNTARTAALVRRALSRTSKTPVLHLMWEAQLLAPKGQAVPVATQSHTGTLTTDRPNPM